MQYLANSYLCSYYFRQKGLESRVHIIFLKVKNLFYSSEVTLVNKSIAYYFGIFFTCSWYLIYSTMPSILLRVTIRGFLFLLSSYSSKGTPSNRMLWTVLSPILFPALELIESKFSSWLHFCFKVWYAFNIYFLFIASLLILLIFYCSKACIFP